MLKCRDVVHQADALLAGDLTGRQRFAMRMHLVICRHCRRYVSQFRRLLSAIPGMHGLASDDEVDKVMAAVEKAEQKDSE